MSSFHFFLAHLSFLAVASASLAEEVTIRAGGESGRGFTLSAGNDCLVVTPKHVVTKQNGDTARSILVQGSLNAQVEATLVRRHPDADLALLSLSDPTGVRCVDQDYTALPQGLQAVTRLESGIVKFFDVELEGENPPEIFVRSELELTKGFSGSSLYLNGDRIGLMYGLDRSTGLIRSYTLDYIYTALNIGQLRPMDVDTAIAALDRAIERRDGSLQGQHVAISTLTARGYTFKGSDLSGVSVEGAVLAGGDISNARLHFSSLASVNAAKLNLSGSGLRFGYLSEANLAQANLEGVFAPFLDAQDLSAPNASFARGNFMLADFRNADLKGADLSEAAFAFADLTGADLRGADLTGAYLTGAVLVDAKLDGATISETNLQGATLSGSELTKGQSEGACRHDASYRSGFEIRLMERWPSDRYDSGYQYDDLLEYSRLPWVGGMDDLSLRLCATSSDKAVAFNANYPANTSMHLDREYLDRAGRKTEAKDRLTAAIERIRRAREKTAIFSGTGSYLDDWVAMMQANAASADVTGTPIASSELIHLHLVKRGLLELSDDLLKRLYETRYRYERAVDSKFEGAMAAHSGWPRFFPEKAPLNDIPQEGFEAYKAWTDLRLASLSDMMTIPIPGCLRPKEGSQAAAFTTATGYLAATAEGTYFPGQVSWPRSSWATVIAQRAGGSERVVGAPVRTMAYAGKNPILFAFAKPYGSYFLELDAEVVEKMPDCTTETELDLKIIKAETDEAAGTAVLLFVEPQELRLFSGDELVAQGKLENDE
jgi:uncharacterized protein YjbI with pentapeptide repeats